MSSNEYQGRVGREYRNWLLSDPTALATAVGKKSVQHICPISGGCGDNFAFSSVWGLFVYEGVKEVRCGVVFT